MGDEAGDPIVTARDQFKGKGAGIHKEASVRVVKPAREILTAQLRALSQEADRRMLSVNISETGKPHTLKGV